MNKNFRKIFIIAEIGINHNGIFDNCVSLINAASDAGCNAVKFQFFKADHLYPRSAGKLDWKDSNKEYSYKIHEAVKSFELPEKWLDGIIEHCRSRRIEFLSSVFDPAGADLLVKKGIKKIKLSSYSLTNIPLLKHCAAFKLSIILSTGASYLGEILKAVKTISLYHEHLSLLHCSLDYPTKPENCNLGIIKTLKEDFPKLTIGYSDHTIDPCAAPIQAIILGAGIIEKHITLDKKMPGPDHFFALEPEELKTMVSEIRRFEKMTDSEKSKYSIDPLLYGKEERIPYPHEEYLRAFAFPCLFAKREIRKGERMRSKDISILRPGKKQRGLEPEYYNSFDTENIIALKDIAFEDPITAQNTNIKL